MALSKTTQDHDEIRTWAEERGGKPAEVASTEGKGGPGILRLEFPGAVHADDSNLKEIEWDDFFEKFDRSGLALVYQEETAEGERSNFNRLIYPENASEKKPAKAAKKSTSTKKGTSTKVGGSTTPKKALKKAPAKESVSGKKSTATKPAAVSAKKATASKTKSGAKKAPAKQTVVKKAAKKAVAKKTPAKKVAAKKTPAKRK